MNRERSLGLPQSSRDSFRLLADARVVPAKLSERLQRMVGLRNIAVHHYQNLDTAIVAAIIRHDLDDLLRYNRMLAALECARSVRDVLKPSFPCPAAALA